MSEAALIYPHQLFEKHPALSARRMHFLIEDPLFFTQYAFHKQKLFFHRASMLTYQQWLEKKGYQTKYIGHNEITHSGDISNILHEQGYKKIILSDPCDDWLISRLENACRKKDLKLEILGSPNFICGQRDLEAFVEDTKAHGFLMGRFYIQQRRKLGILLDKNKPLGGQWSFDSQNRKRIPRDQRPPAPFATENSTLKNQVAASIERDFPNNPGKINSSLYAISFQEAQHALELFIRERLQNYGIYQDAIDQTDSFLFHSVLSPYLNAGLLEPLQIVQRVLHAFEDQQLPLNSIEGFIRQIIGWREYVRLVYLSIGRKQRSMNFFQFKRPIPKCLWSATTGIEILDRTIAGTLQSSYANHIERLMVLSNFMLLCEFDPDQVYEWFMSLYIDAYDWVMVPNVYGMGVFADGGLIVTKPYISSSNYLRKMSWYEPGSWCEIWDALYWSFLHTHGSRFEQNPRMKLMLKQLSKMEASKIEVMLNTKEDFLRTLEDCNA